MDSSVLGGILDLESPQPHHHHHQRRQTTQLFNHPSLTETNPICAGAAFLFNKGKSIEASEEEEEEEEEDEANHKEGKKGNPLWQRMKWSDEGVKLLIAVVACVGDDGAISGEGGQKRKSGTSLQKKGKWKTVSKIMIGKGCQVSPQQCEDKFNDLNKRYKRLNDILGRGTSCRVVENPSLMDSIPNLSAKSKLDVQKILGSKHLFYKEMCAYHNGQAIVIPGFHNLDHHHLHNTSDEEPEEEEEEEEDAEEEEEEENHRDHGHHEDVDDDEDRILEGKSAWERREWVKKRREELEARRVEFEAEALELERQRFRWVRYCGNKDRELERLRLENQRLSLENDRRVLHLKHKDFELSHAAIDRVQARDNHIDLTTPQ